MILVSKRNASDPIRRELLWKRKVLTARKKRHGGTAALPCMGYAASALPCSCMPAVIWNCVEDALGGFLASPLLILSIGYWIAGIFLPSRA